MAKGVSKRVLIESAEILSLEWEHLWPFHILQNLKRKIQTTKTENGISTSNSQSHPSNHIKSLQEHPRSKANLLDRRHILLRPR